MSHVSPELGRSRRRLATVRRGFAARSAARSCDACAFLLSRTPSRCSACSPSGCIRVAVVAACAFLLSRTPSRCSACSSSGCIRVAVVAVRRVASAAACSGRTSRACLACVARANTPCVPAASAYVSMRQHTSAHARLHVGCGAARRQQLQHRWSIIPAISAVTSRARDDLGVCRSSTERADSSSESCDLCVGREPSEPLERLERLVNAVDGAARAIVSSFRCSASSSSFCVLRIRRASLASACA